MRASAILTGTPDNAGVLCFIDPVTATHPLFSDRS
jgi:hypothetical protein